MSITANGIGSGLDISGLVNQLMTLEARPLNQLNTREASFQAQLSAFGQLKSVLSPIQSALSGLKDASRFQAMRATVGDSSMATASADTTAVKGSYSLEVLQIAQGQRVVTNDAVAPSVSEGTLTFNFGSYTTDNTDPDNPVTSFTMSSSATVTLEPGKDSLQDLRDAINEAGIGVRAQVINNGTAEQLIIAGNADGKAGGFQIVGSDGLAGFSYDASTGASSSLDELERAQDARIRLDGVTITRGSNTITDVIEGVTLNLLSGDPDKKTTLNINNDRAAVKTSIESLVKAYNEFNTTVRGLTAVNPDEGEAAILAGDSTARGVQTQMRNAFTAVFNTGPGGVSTLSDMGISFNRDGSLSIDSGKLDTALADPQSNVATFFAGTEGQGGFAAALDERLSGLLQSGGVMDARTDGINNSIKAIDRQRDSLLRRLDMTEQRYRAQFIALDSMVANMMQTSNYLQQQLANLPKISADR